MTLSTKDFAKAQKLHAKIVAMDAEILSIEKMASEIANNKCRIKLSLEVENIAKVQAKEDKEKADELLKDPAELSWGAGILGSVTIDLGLGKMVGDSTNQYELTDYECLNVLATLIKIKYHRRDSLIKRINKLGVKI